MSFAGIVQFEKNLRALMDSQAFKEADWGQRLDCGYRLLTSRYGLGAIMTRKVHDLSADAERSER